MGALKVAALRWVAATTQAWAPPGRCHRRTWVAWCTWRVGSTAATAYTAWLKAGDCQGNHWQRPALTPHPTLTLPPAHEP